MGTRLAYKITLSKWIDTLGATLSPTRLFYRFSQYFLRIRLEYLGSPNRMTFLRNRGISLTPAAKKVSDELPIAGNHSPGTRALRDCIAFVSVGEELDEFLLNSLQSLRRIDSSIPAFVFVGSAEKERVTALTRSLDVTIVTFPGPTEPSRETYNEFGSRDFNRVANQKWHVFLELFGLGYEAVICSDVDIVFLNPFRSYLQSVMKLFPAGFQSEATAQFPPLLCSGFMFFRSIWADEVRFFRNASMKSRNAYNDQDLVNARFSADADFRNGVFELPSHLFPNGRMIEHTFSQINQTGSVAAKPFLFHANWVSGLVAKKKSLTMIGQWIKEPPSVSNL